MLCCISYLLWIPWLALISFDLTRFDTHHNIIVGLHCTTLTLLWFIHLFGMYLNWNYANAFEIEIEFVCLLVFFLRLWIELNWLNIMNWNGIYIVYCTYILYIHVYTTTNKWVECHSLSNRMKWFDIIWHSIGIFIDEGEREGERRVIHSNSLCMVQQAQ